ncbi:MAG: hypothetical protein KGZ71_09845 [Desulfobulbaceae bacterium]|nr:hypothetical protein [Desulfobulbaceae bacterium]
MQLVVFKYQNDEENMLNEIKTVEINNDIWFVASDVCKALGYKNSSDAISRHCKEGGVVFHDIPINRGFQSMKLMKKLKYA